MKAYLIDPLMKEVTEVEVDSANVLADIYKHIRADLCDCLRINAYGDGVYVDDEGLLNGAAIRFGAFSVTGDRGMAFLAGYGLVLGVNPHTGASRNPVASLDVVKTMVNFVGTDYARLSSAQRAN